MNNPPKVDYVSMILSGNDKQSLTDKMGSVEITFEPDAQKNYDALKERGLGMSYEEFEPYHKQQAFEYNKNQQIATEWEQYNNWYKEPNSVNNYERNVTKLLDPTQFEAVGGKTKVNTDEEVMEAQGVYLDKDGGYKDLSVWRGRGTDSKIHADGREYILSKGFDAKTRQPIWAEKPIDDMLKQSGIRSMAGPKAMRQGVVSAFTSQFSNAYTDMFGGTTAGSIQELVGTAVNKLNDDWGADMIAAGRKNQNLAAVRKSKMSEAAESAQMFSGNDKALAWSGGLGSLAGQISMTAGFGVAGAAGARAAQSLGAGARAATGIKYSASMGTMAAYAAAMTDQEAKENGLSNEDRMWLYPKIFAATLATEALLGRNLLEGGLGYFGMIKPDAAATKGAAKLFQDKKLMAEIANRNLSGEAQTGLVSKVLDKYTKLSGAIKNRGDKMQGSRLGRGWTSGVEEGKEELIQGVLENSAKMWHDYSNYGTLDDKGGEKSRGKGLFGLYGKDGGNVSDLVDGWKENLVLGFIGGAVPGFFSANTEVTGDLSKNYSVANHVVELASQGKSIEDAMKYVDNFMADNGGHFNLQDEGGNYLGKNAVDADGNKISTKSDAFGANWKELYKLAFDAHEQNGSVANLNAKMGGDKKLLSEGIAMVLNAQKAEQDLAKYKEDGVAETDPKYIEKQELLERSKDYGQKILNGDVYGHYMAVNALNSWADGEPISTEVSNVKWDEYKESRGRVEANNTLLGKIKAYNERATKAPEFVGDLEQKLKSDQAYQKEFSEYYGKFIPADNAVESLDVGQSFDSFVSEVKGIFEGDAPLSETSMNALYGKVNKAKENAQRMLIAKLDSTIDMDELGDWEIEEKLEGVEGITPSEQALLDMRQTFDWQSDEKLDDKFKDDYITRRNEIFNGGKENVAPSYDSDEDVSNKLAEFETLFPVEVSEHLTRKAGTSDPLKAGFTPFTQELFAELAKESPTVSQENIVDIAALMLEVEDNYNNIAINSLGNYDSNIAKAIGANANPSKEKTDAVLARLNEQKAILQTLLQEVSKHTDPRTAELNQFKEGLAEIKSYILPLLGNDYGIKLTGGSLEAITEAEVKLSEAIVKNPEKLWEKGSAFRKLIAAQDDFGTKTGVREPTSTASQSLFSLSLKNFSLEKFNNPEVDATNGEYKSPYFRKHFMLNYVQSLSGISPSQFYGLAKGIFEGGDGKGIEGAISAEQLNVLQHVVNWTLSASNKGLKETHNRVANYVRTEGESLGHQGNISENKSKRDIYLNALVPHMDKGVVAELAKADTHDGRVAILEAKAEKLSKEIKDKVKQQIDTFEITALNPVATPSYIGAYKNEYFIPNAIMIQGNQGSGKTSRVFGAMLEMLIRMEKDSASVNGESLEYYNPTQPIVVVHSTGLQKTFQENFEALNTRLGDGYPTVTPKIVLKSEFFANLNDYKNKTVVIDEATLLSVEQKEALTDQSRTNGDNYQNLYYFLGDRFQTTNNTVAGSEYQKADFKINNFAISTHNITQVYRSGQEQVIKQMKDNVYQLAYQSRSNQPMPFQGGSHWQSVDGTKRKGMWVTEDYDELKKHLKERIDQGNTDNMAIVVASQKEGKDLLNELTGSDNLEEGLGKQVFFYSEEPLKGSGEIRHIQGLGAEQIYFASDPDMIKKEGFAADVGAYNRMLNTSLGRMRDDGTPEKPDSQMGYFAGTVQAMGGENTKVDTPLQDNIPASSLDKAKLADNAVKFNQYLDELIGGNDTNIDQKAASPNPESGAKSQEFISDNDYKAFVDKGVVSDAVLASIAKKVKNQEPLSKREMAIFQNKTSEIEALIKDPAKKTLFDELPFEDDGTVGTPTGLENESTPSASKVVAEPASARVAKPVTKPPVVESHKVAPKEDILFAYGFKVDGQRVATWKDKPAVYEGEVHTILYFKQTNEHVYVTLKDARGVKKENILASDVQFNFKATAAPDMGAIHSDSKRLTYFGDLTLHTHKAVSNKDVGFDVIKKLEKAKKDLYEFLETNDDFNKRGAQDLPLIGKVISNATVIGSAILPYKANNTFVWSVDKSKLPDDMKDNFKFYAEQLPEEHRDLIYQVGVMPVDLAPSDKFKNKKGGLNEWHIANNLKKAVLNRVKAEGLTLRGKMELKKGKWITGISKNKFGGAKKLLGEFTSSLKKNQYRIAQEPVGSGKDERAATFLYYTTMGSLPENFTGNKQIGKIEILPMPLEHNEGEPSSKSETQAFINNLEKIVDDAAKARSKERNRAWKDELGEFIRYNRKTITKHILRNGRPPQQALIKLGLDVYPDDSKQAVDGFSVLFSGMEVDKNADKAPFRYRWNTKSTANAKQFVKALKKAFEDGTINDTFGKIRFPTKMVRAQKPFIGELAEHPSVGNYERYYISDDLHATPPMPIISASSILELMDDVSEQTQEAEPEVEEEAIEPPPPDLEVTPEGEIVEAEDDFMNMDVEEETDEDETEDDYDEYDEYNRFVGDPDLEAYTLTQKEAREIIKRILGKRFANNNLHFKQGFRQAHQAYGALHQAAIYLDVEIESGYGMVHEKTPAHEAWHKIVEEVIDKKSYEKLYKEYAPETEYYYDGGYASKPLREGLADDFAEYFHKRFFDKGKPKKFISQLIQQLFDAVAHAINYLRGVNMQQQMMYKAYYGKYVAAVDSDVAFEQEHNLVPVNMTTDVFGNDWIKKDGMASTTKPMKVFDNNLSVIDDLKNFVSGKIYNRPFFSILPKRAEIEQDFAQVLVKSKEKVLQDALRAIMSVKGQNILKKQKNKYSFLQKDGNFSPYHSLGALRKYEGKLIKRIVTLMKNLPAKESFTNGRGGFLEKNLGELTAEDLESIPMKGTKVKFFLMTMLEHDTLFDAIVQQAFPRVPVKAVLEKKATGAEAMNAGLYVTDSTDNKSNSEINITHRISDVMRAMIKHTTLLAGGKVNGAVKWDKHKEKRFDFEVGKDLLIEIALKSSQPSNVSELVRKNARDKGRPLTRMEKMIKEIEKQVTNYSEAKRESIDPIEDGRNNHLKSLYEKFFNPDGLSYYAWANNINSYADYAAAIQNQIDQGILKAKLPNNTNVLLGESEFKNGFDNYLAYQKDNSRKYINSLESMFGGLKEANVQKGFFKRFRAAVADGMGGFKNTKVQSVFVHRLGGKNMGGSLKADLDNKIRGFVYDNFTNFALSEKFTNVWKKGHSPDNWRKNAPIKYTSNGLYYVPKGVTAADAVRPENKLVHFDIEKNGTIKFNKDGTGYDSLIKPEGFIGDKSVVVQDFFKAIGIGRIGRGYELFAANNTKLPINWNVFIDIMTKFTFAAKSMVEAETDNEYDKDKYNNWFDFAMEQMLSDGNSKSDYGKMSFQEIAQEVGSAQEDSDISNFDETQRYTIDGLWREMNTVADAMSAGNGMTSNAFYYDSRNNKHYKYIRSNALTDKLDSSGSENYGIRIQQMIDLATTDGILDFNKLDEKVSHLIDEQGRVLNPWLKVNDKGEVKRKIHEWLLDSGIAKGVSGIRIQDMTELDLVDHQFAAFYNHIVGRGRKGIHEGLMINTLFPDADRSQRLVIEADLKISDKVLNSEWTNFGTIMVKEIPQKFDKESKKTPVKGKSYEFKLPYTDIMQHLKNEVDMRNNYQRQSTKRLAKAFVSALDNKAALTPIQKQIIENMRTANVGNQKSLIYDLAKTLKNNPIPVAAIRFSDAWSHRDYIAKDGFINRLGYEFTLKDPGGQEAIMTAENRKAITEYFAGGENDTKAKELVEKIFQPLFDDSVTRFNDAGFTLLPSMNIGETMERDNVPTYEEFSKSPKDFIKKYDVNEHRKKQLERLMKNVEESGNNDEVSANWELIWGPQYFADRYISKKKIPTAMKGFMINHYVMTNYMSSMFSGTPFVYKSMEDANKRNRTITSDYSSIGTADVKLLNALRSTRTMMVEDVEWYSVAPNLNAGDGENTHVKKLEITDGLSEENPVFRYMMYLAYGKELGAYPESGAAKTIYHSTKGITKHSSSVITEDSMKMSSPHKLMLANMLDPTGKRHMEQDNLYDTFMGIYENEGWKEATRQTAEKYMESPNDFPMIGVIHHLSTQKAASSRKVINQGELEGVEAGVFPTNIDEASVAQAIGIDMISEPFDPLLGGVSNTITKDVDESKETMSAQILPVLIANDVNKLYAQQIKQTFAAMAETGFGNFLKELNSSQAEFADNILNSSRSIPERRKYAGKLMAALSFKGLDKTGDRGHLQRLMGILDVGMDIAAKATKTDQSFSSMVRGEAIKFKVAAQRSTDNVVYGAEVIEYQDQIWLRDNLIEHLKRTNPSAVASIEQAESRELKPMHFTVENDAYLKWLTDKLGKGKAEDKEDIERWIKEHKASDSTNTPVQNFFENKDYIIVGDGDKLGVALPGKDGEIYFLMQEDMLDFQADAELFNETGLNEAELEALKEKQKAYGAEMKAKQMFVYENKIGKIEPAEIIAPSSNADMLNATGIPINTLFGLYGMGGDNVRNLYFDALPELRQALQVARMEKMAADENSLALASSKAQAEIEKLTDQITTMTQHIEQNDDGAGYGYESMMGLSVAQMKTKIAEVIKQQFPINADGHIEGVVVDEKGNISLKTNNPNTYLVRMIEDDIKKFKGRMDKVLDKKAKKEGLTASTREAARRIQEEGKYKFMVDTLATRIANNLHKLEGELEGYMVRTPSTGAHSGALVKVIEFSSTEQNTLRQSPLNMHTSGKDLDGDAVSIYHRENVHPDLDDMKDKGAMLKNKEIVQYVMDFYTNPENARTIFEPISTEYAVGLSNGDININGKKAKKKPNSNRFVRGSVGSDLRLINQSFTGKFTISNSANALKNISYITSALQGNPNALYHYKAFHQNKDRKAAKLDVLDVTNVERVNQLSNAISTITNLGTDNAKEQALGVWGMSQKNIDVVLQLINEPQELIQKVNELRKWNDKKNQKAPISKDLTLQEQTWVALNYLFRDNVVQEWIKNQNWQSSMRYTNVANTDAYPTLLWTIGNLRGEQKKNKKIAEELRRDNGDYDAAYKAEKDPAKKKELWAEKMQLEKAEKLGDDKAQDLLFWLAKKAMQAKQMSGFLTIANLNQKLPSTEYELYDWKEKVERLFGLPIDTVFKVVKKSGNQDLSQMKLDENGKLSEDGVNFDSAEAMEIRTKFAFDVKEKFNLASKGAYHAWKVDTVANVDKSESLNFKEDFFKVDTLPALLASPELKAYVKLVENKYKLMEQDRVLETPIVKGWKNELVARVGRDRLSESNHKYLQNQTRNFFISKYIADLAANDADLQNIPLIHAKEDDPIQVHSKDGKSTHNYSVKLNLANNFGTELFMQFFPNYFSIEASKLQSEGYVDENNKKVSADYFQDNIILNTFSEVGGATVNFLKLINDFNMDDNKKMSDFNKLPPSLKKMLSIYAVVKDGFNYRAGSLIEAMSTDIYKDFSNYMKREYLLNEDEAKNEKLSQELKEYEEFVLGQVNEYFLKGNTSKGKSKREVIGTEYGMSVATGFPYVKKGKSLPVHSSNGKHTYSTHRNKLFNTYRAGSDNLVNIETRGLIKRANKKNNTEIEERNQLAVIAMPTANRIKHIKQIIAHKDGKKKNDTIEMTLADKGQASRWKVGDILYFPDGVVAEVESKREMDIEYSIDYDKTLERLKGDNVKSAWDYNLNEGVKKALITNDAHLERGTAVRQSIALVKSLKAAFPNVQVQTVYQNEADRLGGGKSFSFIKNGVVYINLNKVTPQTVIHEIIGHFTSAALFHDNKPVWQDIVKRLQNTKVADMVTRAYPELKGNALNDEIFATWLGLKGSEQESLLNDQSLFGQVKDWFKKMWNKVKSMVLRKDYGLGDIDFMNMTLDDIASTLIKGTLKGDVIIPFSSAEYAALWGGVRMDKLGNRVNLPATWNTGNLIKMFEESSSKFSSNTKKRAIESKIPRMVENVGRARVKKGVKQYFSPALNKTFDIDKMTYANPSKLDKALRKIALDEYKESLKTTSKILDFFNLVSSKDGWTPTEAAKKTIRTKYESEIEPNAFLDNEVKTLINVFGFDSHMDKAYAANDTKLKEYGLDLDSEFLKDNPIVIVHGAKSFDNGDADAVSFSLFNTVPHGLDDQSNPNPSSKNLADTIIYDGTLPKSGINLYNTVSDINKVFQGLALIDAHNKNQNLKFRNVGTVSLWNFGSKSKDKVGFQFSLNHLESLLPQLQKLFKHQNVNPNLEGKLKDLVNNKNSFDPKRYSQSIMHQLLLISKSYSHNGINSDRIHWNKIHEIASEHLDPTKGSASTRLTNAIRKKIEFIEGQYENNAEGMAADQTLQFLNLAVINAKSQRNIWEIIFEKKNIIQRNFEMSTNWKEPILQHWRDALNNALYQTNTQLQKVLDKTNALVIAQKKIKNVGNVETFTTDIAIKLFEKLFKKKTMPVYGGGEAEVNAYEIHWDKNDPETLQAISDGHIEKEELDIANGFIDVIEEYMVEAIRNFDLKDGSERRSKADAKDYLYKHYDYSRGMLPAMSQSWGESATKAFKSGSLKDKTIGLLGNFAKNSLSHFGLHDSIEHKEELLDDVAGNIMLMQFSPKKEKRKARLKMLGLKDIEQDDGSYKTMIDPDNGLQKNSRLTVNLQSIADYTAALTIRSQSFLTHFVPTHKSVMALINSWGVMQRKAKSSKDIAGMMEKHYNKIVLGKTDNVLDNLGIPGMEGTGIKVEAVLNTVNKLFVNGVLGLRPSQVAKEAGVLYADSYAFGYTNYLQNNEFYTHKDFNKAIDFTTKNGKLVDRINDAIAVANKSERDFLGGRWNVETQKGVLEADTLHFGSAWNSYKIRKAVMIAQLIKDGSLKAYSLDSNGNLQYDQLKDDVFAKNGKMTEDGKKIAKLREQNLIDNKYSLIERKVVNGKVVKTEKTQKDNKGKLLVGIDFRGSARLKGIADTFITGGQSSDVVPAGYSNALTRLFLTFRGFSISKLQRYLTSQERYDLATEKVVDGEIEYSAPEFKAILATYIDAVRAIKKANGNPAAVWNEMSDADKYNLRESMLDITKLGMSLVAAYGGTYAIYAILVGLDLTDEDEEMGLDARKSLDIKDSDTAGQVFAKGFSKFFVDTMHRISKEQIADVAHPTMLYEYVKDPIPSLSFVINIADMISMAATIDEIDDLEKLAKKMSYQIPGAGLLRETSFTYEAVLRAINLPDSAIEK